MSWGVGQDWGCIRYQVQIWLLSARTLRHYEPLAPVRVVWDTGFMRNLNIDSVSLHTVTVLRKAMLIS